MLSLSTHTVLEHLNNIVEQEHRAVKRRLRACQGFRCFHAAWRTLQGIETMNIICGEVSDADLKSCATPCCGVQYRSAFLPKTQCRSPETGVTDRPGLMNNGAQSSTLLALRNRPPRAP